ncbi:MAG: hypothetical protein QNK37_26810 [Acidobacteriota bacterium]|nr:hypothetical protein [Acidobacteriota bacterium]
MDLPKSMFAQGRGLCMDDHSFYISDPEDNNLIKQYSHKGELIRTFGGTGQGPGEFTPMSLSHLTIRDDLLFALEYGFSINVFAKGGEFVDKIDLPSMIFETRAAVDPAMRVFISTPLQEHPIGVYDLHGAFHYGFGNWLGDRPEETQRTNHNARYLFFNQAGNLVSISRATAHIEIYAPDGKLLRERQMRYDRRFRAYFSKVDDYFRMNPGKYNQSTFQLVRDAALLDDKLLFIYNVENPEWDDLMIVDVAGDQIGKNARNYLLKGKDGGHLTGFLFTARNGMLHIYDSNRNWIYHYHLPSSLFKMSGPG